jgi:transmembrane sensor
MSGSSPQTSAHLDPVEREARHWLMRFAAGNADRAELETFKQWSARDPAHAEAFARACRLWDALGPAGEVAAAQPRRTIATSPPMRRRAFLGGALAASAAAVAYLAVRPPLGLWPSLSELRADYRTGVGEQRSVALADGPLVELNTRTSIVVVPVAGGPAHMELISGEAAVSVAPDKARAVEVVAAGGRVVATNSTFNLRCDGDTVIATCLSGAIEVRHGGRSAQLQAQQQVTYSSNGLGPVTVIDPAVVTAWQEGLLVFHSTPLAEAVAEINRYRSGRIILTNAALGRRLFNARFRIKNVDGIVTQIQEAFGASVTTLPHGIVLLS